MFTTSRWTKWVKAAGIRAIRTFAQTMLAMIGGNTVGVMEVDWGGILSVATTAAIMSLLTSLAGLPELEEKENEDDEKRTKQEETKQGKHIKKE